MRKLIAWVFMYSLDGLIDELRLDVHPYVAGEGTRLFDGVPASYRLDLVASAEFANGVVGLHDRRPRRRRPSSEQPGTSVPDDIGAPLVEWLSDLRDRPRPPLPVSPHDEHRHARWPGRSVPSEPAFP